MQLTPTVIAAKGISKSVKTACVIVALLISSHQLYQAVHKYWQGASVKKKPFSHLQVTEIRNRHALLLKMSGLSFEIISCIGQGVFPKHLSKRFKNANPSSVLLKFGKAIAE